MVRKMLTGETNDLLSTAVVARLATIDKDGYPHVTPLWFHWSPADELFHMTSFSSRPHLSRIQQNAKVGLLIDIEDELRPDGERPNRQVRITGTATVNHDSENYWTERIRDKYIGHPRPARQEAARSVITIKILSTVAVASV